jgi:hypothetical protein
MDHYKIWLDDVLSIPVETLQEQIIDYLIKSYMAKRMNHNDRMTSLHSLHS